LGSVGAQPDVTLEGDVGLPVSYLPKVP
jgi:hypothetical protein